MQRMLGSRESMLQTLAPKFLADLDAPAEGFNGVEEGLEIAPFALFTLKNEWVDLKAAFGDRNVLHAFYLLHYLENKATKLEDSRLVILLMDFLIWTMEAYPEKAGDLLNDFVETIRLTRAYIISKGANHVFICLSKSCKNWIQRFAELLADHQGSRAIYVGSYFNEEPFQWPCPFRIIHLGHPNIQNNDAVIEKILRRVSFMIQERNLWVCSDEDHPAHHFGEHAPSMHQGGIYIKE